MTNKELLKVGEVLKVLRISRKTFYRWVKEGRIKVVRLPSGRYRVPKSEIERILGGAGHDQDD